MVDSPPEEIQPKLSRCVTVLSFVAIQSSVFPLSLLLASFLSELWKLSAVVSFACNLVRAGSCLF